MTDPFIGPLPYAETPEQPRFGGRCVAWTAFDVPRIWDILAEEDNPRGWEQIIGFRQLAELLVDHHRRMKTQHHNLSQAWQSPAAEQMLLRVDGLCRSLLSDANCAASTAYGLHGIMTTYADARVKVAGLYQEWNRVTTDWVPEWWDRAAEELNTKAQAIMEQTDVAVGDHRTRILAPELPYEDRDRPDIDTDSGPGDASAGLHTPIPPVPGHMPYTDSGITGPELASSGVAYVPAMPGQPVSMLPIQPGSHQAPHGGAYILPGPGVGRGGYVVPMPAPGGVSAAGRGGIGAGRGGGNAPGRYGPAGLPPGARPIIPGGAPGSGMGMMPMPFGAPPPNNSGSGGALYRRPNTVWPASQGVPPVIEGIPDDTVIPDQPSEKQEDAFKEWFAELAYPWRSENKGGSEPHIVLRKVPE